MTPAKVELGRRLFYDPRLSRTGKMSCASCHKQELAFTDGRPAGIGVTGEKHSRGSMSLVNIAYNPALTWSNPRMRNLEQQALVPLLGEHPVELGINSEPALLEQLRSVALYRQLFPAAFPGSYEPFTPANVTKAIASFERSIIAGGSAWDRYHYGRDDAAISESAKRGETLFFSQPLSCFRCHGGFNFSGPVVSEARPDAEPSFHNTGLYNVAGEFSYPPPNTGIFEHTRDPKDVGKFKAPTLRNIALTAPYMHDGSLATLEDVVNHYAAGGSTNPNKDPLIGGFKLSSQERNDLIEFLRALTDTTLTTDPRFSNPW